MTIAVCDRLGLNKFNEMTADNCINSQRRRIKPGARSNLKVPRLAINCWHTHHGPLKSIPPVNLLSA
ncbi:hypothetical protein BH11PSE4_BH11PSE4_41170 [soil metagenome]